MLVALVISSVIIAGGFSIFISQGKGAVKQENVVEMQQGVRLAMDVIVRDLQMAGFDDQSTAAVKPAIPIDLTNGIYIQYERNGGVLAVSYQLVDGRLMRTETFNNVDTGEVLLENVVGFERTPTLMSGVNKIVSVRVRLAAGPTLLNSGLVPRELVSDVALRNALFSK
jgi:hypothetical protein